MQRAVLWDDWSCPFDLYSDVGARDFQAFAAIMEGRNEKRREEAEKQERNARRKGKK